MDVSVVIALPVNPEEEERKREKRLLEVRENEDEEGEDLPELWLGVERLLVGH